MEKEKPIQIDQALYGYSDGHRLLASSRKLSRTAERITLVLSDMSGPSMVPGFDEYLTGYPLPEEEIYAFAKTWYAPEMQRPGCVWTHTLLIKNKDLCKIPNLSVLCKFFQRPPKELLRREYEETIPLNSFYEPCKPLTNKSSDFHETLYEVTSLEHFAGHIIFHLYGNRDCPTVLLVAPRSTMYEKLILKLWSQQWPELRYTFAFCTGSLSKRSLDGRQFDLQVIPVKAEREFEREAPGAQILKPEKNCSASLSFKWVSIATRDLLHDKSGKLRKYLWEVGDVSNVKRSLYASLVKIYDCLDAVNANHMAIEDLLAELEKSCPSPREGKVLKKTIFGPFTRNQKSLLENFDEPDLLKVLALTRYQRVFSARELKVRSRTRSLWEIKNDKFRHVIVELLESEVNSLGEEVLIGVAEVIQPDELLKLAKSNPSISFIFIEKKPELASYKGLWMGRLNYQRELLEHLAKALPKEKTVNAAVKAMLDANTDGIGENAYECLGKPVVNALLEWFDGRISSRDVSLGPSWMKVLRKAPEETLHWLINATKPKARTVALIASQLDPHASTTKEFGTRIWLKLLDVIKSDLDYKTHRALAEFLLPFSLTKPGHGYEQLAKFSFDIVHDALAHSDLSYDSWQRLEPLLPIVPWYRSWDKCERLRRGMKQVGVGLNSPR